MPVDFLRCIPGVLSILSLSHVAIMIFFPYWALFYHHHHHILVFTSPWIICVRKQCKFIKNLGLSEVTQASLIMSLVLSLPLGLSLPAQCVNILSGPLHEIMPVFTSLIYLSVGIAELLSVVFFRLMLNQLKFLLKEFDLWVNWPVYLILVSSLLYIGVGAFFYHHHVNSDNSQRGKQATSRNTNIPSIAPSALMPRSPEFLLKTTQEKEPATSQTVDVPWDLKSQSTSPKHSQKLSLNMKSFFPKSALSCIPEQSESTLSAISSLSYLGSKVAVNIRHTS